VAPEHLRDLKEGDRILIILEDGKVVLFVHDQEVAVPPRPTPPA
jgi:hypothetical protein